MMHTFLPLFRQWIGILAVFASSSLALPAIGQDLNYGIKVGTNINQFRSQQAQWVSKQWTPRPVVGLYLQAQQESSNFFMQYEVLFSQKSGVTTFTNNSLEPNTPHATVGQQVRRNVHFIDIPVVIGKKLFDQKAAVYAGTTISYPIFARQSGGIGQDDQWYNTQALNTLLVYQLGVQLKLRKKMRLDIRYERNLWNLGFVLPSGHSTNDQLHNIQVALLWDLFSETEDVFKF